MWLQCIDDQGLEGIIEYGWEYETRALVCGAVEVRVDDTWITVARSRFRAPGQPLPRDLQ